jgi:hypothetical protein
MIKMRRTCTAAPSCRGPHNPERIYRNGTAQTVNQHRNGRAAAVPPAARSGGVPGGAAG